MPYTLNGIGTRYYGSSNRSARIGVCKSCKRSATLASYDTREFFCLIYIPVIPLTKFRILDECSSCRRHHRIKATDFKNQVDRSLKPLRDAIQMSPRDPQAHIKLVQTLIGWQLRSEAQTELDAATAMFPQNVELLLLAGELAVDRGEFERALPMYERARAAEPQNAAAVYGLGWLLNEMQRYDQAVPVLQQAITQDHNKKGALYLLGTAQMKLQRWNEALNAFQQLLTIEPKFMADKKLLRLVRECKEKLGYQLTDAERRAGRSWWPFGKSKKRVKLQAAPVTVRPVLKYAGFGILALAALSFIVVGWDRKKNIEVYFDNGLNRPVKVELDGQRFDVPRLSPHKEEMHEGSHTVIVRETSGKELERMTFRLDELGLTELLHERFFVYNIASQRVYRRANHGYAIRQENATYSDELVAMKRFFEERDVDYAFAEVPKTIDMDANASVEHKISFNTADDVTLSRYALVRLREGKTDEAKQAIAQAAANAPCDTPTRRTQVYIVNAIDTPDAASKAAHQWIGDCAQDDLEAHRAYQDINRESGHHQELRAEYQSLLAASPQSAKAHYLYGRVLADPAAAAVEYNLALELDPNLSWARVALGHAYSSLERDADALREYEAALDMKGHDPSILTYYAAAAVAAGAPAEAVSKIDAIEKSHPDDYIALNARWLVAVAAQDWPTALHMQEALAPLEGEEGAWWRKAKMLRIKNDNGIESAIDAANRKPALRLVAANALMERLMEKGEYEQSAALVAQHAKDLDPGSVALLQAYAAGGLLMRGRNEAAMKILDDAEKVLDGTPKTRDARIASAVIAGLRGTMSVAQVKAMTDENDARAHGWFVAAVRASVAHDRRQAADSLAHCVKAASDLEFPYLAARSMREAIAAGG